jgi:hypothetical protein
VAEREDELIAELRDLATWLEAPEPADQRAAVRARLAPARNGLRGRLRGFGAGGVDGALVAAIRGRRRFRAILAGALAAVAVTVIAVAPARAAVVDAVTEVLRIAGIEVRREAAAPNPNPSPLPSTGDVTLAEATRAFGRPVKVPAALGPPERVQIADQGRVVTLIYRGGAVRLDQVDGSAASFLKQAGPAEWTDVGNALAVWLPGPHTLTYIDREGVERSATARLATPTLIWDDGSMTYRLEGLTDLAEAKRAALSMQ